MNAKTIHGLTKRQAQPFKIVLFFYDYNQYYLAEEAKKVFGT